MSANDICYIKVVGQHDGGSEFILSGKTLSQNEGEVVDFTPIEHLLAKIAKTGPYWGLTVTHPPLPPPPPKTLSCSRSIAISFMSSPFQQEHLILTPALKLN